MNRWELYELLKNNEAHKYSPRKIEELINKTSVQELREGLIEYLLFKIHGGESEKDMAKRIVSKE